jgi:hypothetical protein
VLELDVSRKRDRDSAGCSKIAPEARENLVERAKAAGEQTMWVSILRRARKRSGGHWQAVTLEDFNLLKVFGQSSSRRQPPCPGSDHHRPPAQEAVHASPRADPVVAGGCWGAPCRLLLQPEREFAGNGHCGSPQLR